MSGCKVGGGCVAALFGRAVDLREVGWARPRPGAWFRSHQLKKGWVLDNVGPFGSQGGPGCQGSQGARDG